MPWKKCMYSHTINKKYLLTSIKITTKTLHSDNSNFGKVLFKKMDIIYNEQRQLWKMKLFFEGANLLIPFYFSLWTKCFNFDLLCMKYLLHHVCIRTNQNPPDFFFNEKLSPIGAKSLIFIDPRYKQCPSSLWKEKKNKRPWSCIMFNPTSLPLLPNFFLTCILTVMPPLSIEDEVKPDKYNNKDTKFYR